MSIYGGGGIRWLSTMARISDRYMIHDYHMVIYYDISMKWLYIKSEYLMSMQYGLPYGYPSITWLCTMHGYLLAKYYQAIHMFIPCSVLTSQWRFQPFVAAVRPR